MEIRVFNKFGRPMSIFYKNILSITMINRRLCYTTNNGIFYSARNLRDIGKLYEREGMFQTDKNNLINLNRVDHVIKGDAYIKGKKYPVARRRKPELNRKWKMIIKSTD